MAVESKSKERDMALVNILERMADQIGKQEILLDKIVRLQNDSVREVSSAQLHRRSLQAETERAIDKLGEAISRFRADMLSLVNEQDSITKNMLELNKLISQAAYQLELTNRKITDMDENVKNQDKVLNDKSDNIIKQTGMIPTELADISRKDAKLHAETEKRIVELQQGVARQLEKMQKETSRRLVILGDIDSRLETLLIRTEPPEKRPLLIVRIVKKTGYFFKHIFTTVVRAFRD